MIRRLEWILAPQDSLDLYTMCCIRNLSYFGETFLRLNYSEMTKKYLYIKLKGGENVIFWRFTHTVPV